MIGKIFKARCSLTGWALLGQESTDLGPLSMKCFDRVLVISNNEYTNKYNFKRERWIFLHFKTGMISYQFKEYWRLHFEECQ